MHIPLVGRDTLFRKGWEFADDLIQSFKLYADDLKVFDIVQNDHRSDISVRIFCHLPKDANEAFSSIKTALNDQVRTNVVNSHNYDQIATAAAKEEHSEGQKGHGGKQRQRFR